MGPLIRAANLSYIKESVVRVELLIFGQQLPQWLWMWPQSKSRELSSEVQAWQVWGPLQSPWPWAMEPRSQRTAAASVVAARTKELSPSPNSGPNRQGQQRQHKSQSSHLWPESPSGPPNSLVTPLFGAPSSCHPLQDVLSEYPVKRQDEDFERALNCRVGATLRDRNPGDGDIHHQNKHYLKDEAPPGCPHSLCKSGTLPSLCFGRDMPVCPPLP